MNEILKKRIEEAAVDGSKHYDPNVSKYSQGKQVGYVRGIQGWGRVRSLPPMDKIKRSVAGRRRLGYSNV